MTFERCQDPQETPPVPDGPLSTDPDVAAAQRDRAAMGLPSDIATVEGLLLAGPGADGWLLRFPHTEEELEALTASDVRLEDLRAWGESAHLDTWGGMWLDGGLGGAINVAFTRDVDARVVDIADRFGLDVRGVQVAFTHAQLRAAQASLTPVMRRQREARDQASPQPGDLTMTMVHLATNKLWVGIYADDETAKRELAELVEPAMVCLEIEELRTADDAIPADWAPSPHADLSPDSTAIALDVVERACASATPADGRIVVHDIRYDEDTVIVRIGVIPLPGHRTCPGNPITPFTLELDEPLNGRQLLDGAGEPPSTPTLQR